LLRPISFSASDGIRYAISGEVGFSVKGSATETANFDLVASEVVPGESHNPAVATSTDSTIFHVHITPQVAQNFSTHMKFRYWLPFFRIRNVDIAQVARLQRLCAHSYVLHVSC
jgi:hypothetical protein